MSFEEVQSHMKRRGRWLTNRRSGFEPRGAGWERGGIGRVLGLSALAPVCREAECELFVALLWNGLAERTGEFAACL